MFIIFCWDRGLFDAYDVVSIVGEHMDFYLPFICGIVHLIKVTISPIIY